MSHFSNVKTLMNDLDIIEEAVNQMGYTLERGDNIYAQGYSGQRIKVDAKITGKQGFDIGFKQNEDSELGSYDLVVDWWGAAREFGAPDVFTASLTDKYTEQNVMNTAAQNRWNLANREETQEDDGEYVVLTFRQFGGQPTSRWGGV